MKTLLLLILSVTNNFSKGQSIPGELLHKNGIDSTANTIIFSIDASSCKNCIYSSKQLLDKAETAGYKIYFSVRNLAKEDAEYFIEENGFASQYPLVIDKELTQSIESNHIYVLTGKQIIHKADCYFADGVYDYLNNKESTFKKETDIVDSVPVETSYKFYSGSGAYLNNQYCLVMDFRHSRKLHKIDLKTGKIIQQLKIDEKKLAERVYEVVYNNDVFLVNKSLKARQIFLKRDRIFNQQEFEPENITVKNNKIILSVRFHFPYINSNEDTLSKNTKVLLQLSEDMEIIDYWVAPLGLLKDDFYIPVNTDMTPLLLLDDTVCLPVSYVHYGKNPPIKHNYAKFILDESHRITFHSYLPFTVPNDKGEITGDYNVPHMYLFKFKDQIAGSYITFPAIYNLSNNQKIYDVELVGRPKKLKGRLDSMLFAKDVNNLNFVINFFERYNDKYYIMQCKNGSWNTFILFDNNLNHVKTSYFSPIEKDMGRPFYTSGDTIYFMKFGVKEESDMYIVKWSISNIFDMELD